MMEPGRSPGLFLRRHAGASCGSASGGDPRGRTGYPVGIARLAVSGCAVRALLEASRRVTVRPGTESSHPGWLAVAGASWWLRVPAGMAVDLSAPCRRVAQRADRRLGTRWPVCLLHGREIVTGSPPRPLYTRKYSAQERAAGIARAVGRAKVAGGGCAHRWCRGACAHAGAAVQHARTGRPRWYAPSAAGACPIVRRFGGIADACLVLEAQRRSIIHLMQHRWVSIGPPSGGALRAGVSGCPPQGVTSSARVQARVSVACTRGTGCQRGGCGPGAQLPRGTAYTPGAGSGWVARWQHQPDPSCARASCRGAARRAVGPSGRWGVACTSCRTRLNPASAWTRTS